MEPVVGWCRECEWIETGGDGHAVNGPCRGCGALLVSFRSLTGGEKAIVRMRLWLRDVKGRSLGGPSPGGAAQRLRCARSMVDALVDRGVLERSEYKADGHHVVMISSRSIEAAVATKRKTGKWTDSRLSKGVTNEQ
jgi:hypothetical protein